MIDVSFTNSMNLTSFIIFIFWALAVYILQQYLSFQWGQMCKNIKPVRTLGIVAYSKGLKWKIYDLVNLFECF